jgi:hypothetical protein
VAIVSYFKVLVNVMREGLLLLLMAWQALAPVSKRRQVFSAVKNAAVAVFLKVLAVSVGQEELLLLPMAWQIIVPASRQFQANC